MRLKRKERTGENEREHPFEESAAPERDALAIDPPTVESGAPDAPSEDGAGHLAPWIPSGSPRLPSTRPTTTPVWQIRPRS